MTINPKLISAGISSFASYPGPCPGDAAAADGGRRRQTASAGDFSYMGVKRYI
jgi:hypothetical protein